MTNDNKNKLRKFANMAMSKQLQKDFNDEMVRKTWQYQQKYDFEISPKQGHEFWNNEADAFKHTFGSADMYFNMGNAGSIVGGIVHENETPHNPYYEWKRIYSGKV